VHHKNVRAWVGLACALIAGSVAAGPAQAAEQRAYAAGMNYATPAVTVGQGDTLVFSNLDSLAQHDLVGHDGSFGSPLIGGGQEAKVEGVENLNPGTYQFHCTLHSWMRGALTVGPAGGAPTPSPGGDVGGGLGGNNNPDPADIYRPASKGFDGGTWPFYGRDLSNTRDGADGGPPADKVDELGIAWSFFSGDGDFTGTPVVARNTVVAGTNKGKVVAIDAKTGKQKWAHNVGKTINGTVAINGYRVFVPIAEPHRPRILSLDLRTGRPQWETVIDTQKNADVYGSPVVFDGKVFMGVSAEYGELNDPEVSVRGSVVAVEARTGKMRWKTYTVPEGLTGGSVWTTPAIDRSTGHLFVGTGNAYQKPAHENTDAVLMLDEGNGRILDHFQATAGDVWNGTSNAAEGPDHDFGASPNLIEGPNKEQWVGIGQKSGTYWALDRATLEPRWNTLTGPPAQVGGIVGSTAYDGHRIYGPDTPGGESWALGRDGSRSWISADGGPLHFNATSTANGVVYTADMSGFLTARDANTGLVLTKIPLGAPSWGGVSIAGGTIFVAVGTQSSTGYIAAYRVRTGNEPNEPADHWDDQPPPDPNAETVDPHKHKKCKKPKGKKRTKKAMRKYRKCKKKLKKHEQEHPAEGTEHGEDDGHEDGHTPSHDAGPGGGPLKPIKQKSDRYQPKPPGTTERLSFVYGPYVVPPGHDMNRVDLDLPPNDGFMQSVEPGMRRVNDSTEPSHQEAHIHHAHWFALRPGNGSKEDNYFRGNAEWIFGNGDEETRGDFRQRSAADPQGPEYGAYIKRGDPQAMIYMLHNKTAAPLNVYIELQVVWKHGTPEELEKIDHREHRDVTGVLFGDTYDVPRNPNGDGTHQYARDMPKPLEWTATTDGTLIGMGGHVHPGGKQVIVENYGPADNPCPNDGRGYGGTLLLKSDVIDHNVPLSEDYQTEVTHPAWRAPVRKGDRIRISGTYENKDHAWYSAMTHVGSYIDEKEPPKGRCKPYIIGKAKKKWKDPTEGVPNRAWGKHTDPWCGEQYGKEPCDRPEPAQPPAEVHTNVVKIANFAYLPGDRGAGGVISAIPVIKQGERLTFVNDDQAANIRHSVTTCAWPCNGKYTGNYPLADGAWDSGTLGYDLIDGGSPNPVAQTSPELPAGKYSYYCRVHPFMRGAFKVE
jgi:polyvinyl alcohol dehydrogenase (cytochrome)